MTPTEYVGNIMELAQERRGIYKDMTYIDEGRVMLTYELPLNEIIYDFFDALKSRTKGMLHWTMRCWDIESRILSN